ncbi:MAG: hypothetical protein WD670_00310 [Actinomycetota bacterium]
MSDRVIRRAMRHLGPAEGLMASLLGYEQDGRRRHIVLATDQRILIAPVRPAPPTELRYQQLESIEVVDGALVLTTRDGEQHTVERVTEDRRLDLMVALLRGRAGEPSGHHRPAPPKVRIVTV